VQCPVYSISVRRSDKGFHRFLGSVSLIRDNYWSVRADAHKVCVEHTQYASVRCRIGAGHLTVLIKSWIRLVGLARCCLITLMNTLNESTVGILLLFLLNAYFLKWRVRCVSGFLALWL